jgi:hypothetical protein
MTLVERVARERRRLRGLLALEGALLGLAASGLALAAGVVLLGGHRWLELPGATPSLVWAVVLALGAYAALRARGVVRREADVATVSTAIERDLALRSGALRVALEVGDRGALGRRAAGEVDARLAGAGPTLARATRGRIVRRMRLAGAAAGAAAVALVATGASASDGWAPMVHPLAAAQGRLLPALRVDAPAYVVRGEALTVRVEAMRRRTVTVRTRARGAAWRDDTVAIAADGLGQLRVPRADADLLFVASDGRATSDTARVRVVERPFVGDVVLQATYPAYLVRARENLVVGELLRVPQGTVIAVSGRASTPLSSVSLERAGERVSLVPDGQRFAGRFAPRANGRWSWEAAGRGGRVSETPPPLDVEIVLDSAPRVELLSPSRDSTVSVSDRVRIAIGASDDHGLSRVELRTTRRTASGAALPPAVQSLVGRAPSPWMGEAQLDLASRGLEPGDELHVIAVASDETPWGQRGESRALVLRVPSLSEQRAMARATADSAVSAAAATAAEQRDLQRRTAEQARARNDRAKGAQEQESNASARSEGRPPSMSFENAEKARSLAKEQRSLAERVEQLQEQAGKLERQLRDAGAMDPALQQRLEEVQRLLKDAITPEMADKLAQLENSAQKLQGDAARQAMSDLAAQQQRLREQLERSVEMLKRAALEGAMETLRDEADELAKQERSLADSLAGRPRQQAASSDSGSRAPTPNAKQLAERSKDLAKDLDKLSERLEKEGAKTGAKRTESASQQAARSAESLGRAMRQQSGQQGGEQGQQGQEQPESGQPQEGAEAAEAAADEMEKAAQEMAAARDQQVDEWKNALGQELDKAILETMQLARQEEKLAEGSDGGEGERAQARSEQSAVQQGANRLGERVSQAAQSSSHVSPRSQRAMADAVRKVAEATREASDPRNGGQRTSNAMRDASAALNQAAAALVRDRERLGSARSASGFQEMMQRMQELAKQQGALAAQAAGMSIMPGPQRGNQPGAQGKEGKDGQQSGSQKGDARSLARGQREVAQGLEDVSDGDASGRTEDMAAEARRLAQQLERGVVDQSVIDRQQRLFRRLLDAGRSLEQDEREDTGKREARSATDPALHLPEGTDASGRAAQRFRAPDWNELRGLTAEERRVVLEYFKRLNAEQP